MTKSDLMTTLSAKEKLSAKSAADIVNMIFDGFTELFLFFSSAAFVYNVCTVILP